MGRRMRKVNRNRQNMSERTATLRVRLGGGDAARDASRVGQERGGRLAGTRDESAGLRPSEDRG